jgi:hypothetical protein
MTSGGPCSAKRSASALRVVFASACSQTSARSWWQLAPLPRVEDQEPLIGRQGPRAHERRPRLALALLERPALRRAGQLGPALQLVLVLEHHERVLVAQLGGVEHGLLRLVRSVFVRIGALRLRDVGPRRTLRHTSSLKPRLGRSRRRSSLYSLHLRNRHAFRRGAQAIASLGLVPTVNADEALRGLVLDSSAPSLERTTALAALWERGAAEFVLAQASGSDDPAIRCKARVLQDRRRNE